MSILDGVDGLAAELREANLEIAEAALTLIVGLSHAGYSVVVKSRKGSKSDVHFQKDGNKPFSFIFNKTVGLLFYLREDAKDIPFPMDLIEGGTAGERTTRINNSDDALQCLRLLGISTE